MKNNQLFKEKSPYLRQHLADPVWWYPWGEGALGAAKKQNKPILLSVGYSACHWCHVMGHESFADPQTADIMNKFFINIKVDREERPDVDSFCQEALHLFGQQGGWPATLFLTPKGKPFFGGTYFPKEACGGRPSLLEVLWQIARFWREDAPRLRTQGAHVFGGLSEALRPTAGVEGLAPEKASTFAYKLLPFIDADNGGFGREAKFPHVPQLLLLWYGAQAGHLSVKEGKTLQAAVRFSVDKLCQGGLADHVGGGFFRYTVDPAWHTPHFEKMLLDNAHLLDLLTTLWCGTKNPLYQHHAYRIVQWVLVEMQLEGGGFATALDADGPDGVEGAFYMWSALEIQHVLGAEDARRIFSAYCINPTQGGAQHLRLAGQFSVEEQANLTPLLAKLAAARAQRPHPFRDDKTLLDANSHMLAALAKASQVFAQPTWLAAAERAYAFLQQNLRSPQGLHYSWCAGVRQRHVFLEGYAAFISAGLTLYEVTMNPVYLKQALADGAALLPQFEDTRTGGFYQAMRSSTAPLPFKPQRDTTTPNPNGLMMQNFVRLYHGTGNAAWRVHAQRTYSAFSGQIEENVFAKSSFILGQCMLNDLTQLILVGQGVGKGAPNHTPNDILAQAWQRPEMLKMVLHFHPEETKHLPKLHPAYGKIPPIGTTMCYVCKGGVCTTLTV